MVKMVISKYSKTICKMDMFHSYCHHMSRLVIATASGQIRRGIYVRDNGSIYVIRDTIRTLMSIVDSANIDKKDQLM